MSNNNKSSNQEHVVDSSLVPNEFLASERKKKGIDERDAADALKISVARLRSIEAGNYNEFPSETYVKGHLRNYSRFLKLDEDAVVAAYSASNPPSFDYVNPEKNIDIKSTGSKTKRTWLFLLLFSGLIAIWVAAHEFLGEARSNVVITETPSVLKDNSGSVNASAGNDTAGESSHVDTIKNADTEASEALVDTSLTESDLTEQVLESGAGANISGDIAEQLAEGLNTGLATPLDDESIESEPSVLPLNDISSEPDIVVSKVTAAELVKSVMNADEEKLVEEAARESNPTENVLSFKFENPCWVKVVGANGEVIFAGLKPAGSSLRVNGDAPFNIVLGNVDGTSLAYNGETVVLEKQTNGRPLRFVVGG